MTDRSAEPAEGGLGDPVLELPGPFEAAPGDSAAEPAGSAEGTPGDPVAEQAGPAEGARHGSLRALLVRRREQILFVIVGAWNTAFGYGVFALFYWLLQESVPATLILLPSYAVAFVNNFLCYKYIVFRTQGGQVGEVLRFMVVYIPVLAANLIVLPLALRTLPLSAYVIQAGYILVVAVLSYLGLKLFAFRRS